MVISQINKIRNNSFFKISIIIPVFNVEQYLSKCLDSVINQQNVDIEILLINDGSTDSSGSICDEYARNDKRIRVFYQQNNGVSAARNCGIENATGNWICFVDADDWIEPDSLSDIIASSKDYNNDITIAKSFIKQNRKLGKERYPFDKHFVGQTFNGVDLAVNEGYQRGSVCGVLFKTKFLHDHNIRFPLSMKNGEDALFSSICFIHARNVGFADVHLYNIFERPGSASRSRTFENILSMTKNISYIKKYIELHPHLTNEGINILNYNIYRTVSSIYNSFYYCFSFENYLLLRYQIRKEMSGSIDIGNIKSSKNKIRILNISVDLFAVMLLINSFIRNQRK